MKRDDEQKKHVQEELEKFKKDNDVSKKKIEELLQEKNQQQANLKHQQLTERDKRNQNELLNKKLLKYESEDIIKGN